MNCIGAKLQKPLAKLAKTANPSLTSNAALLRARLDGARTRGGCEAVPPRSKKSGGGLFSALVGRRLAASTAAYRADGWVTKDGGSYSLLPAAAGASEGNLRMAGSPLQMLRGGSMVAGGNHMPQVCAHPSDLSCPPPCVVSLSLHTPMTPLSAFFVFHLLYAQFDVPKIDVVDWLLSSFNVDDYVVLKMDVEGAEIEIVPKLLATNATRLIDVFLWECHAKWRGTKGKCQCASWEEQLRRAGVPRVYREKYPFAHKEKDRAAQWKATAAAEEEAAEAEVEKTATKVAAALP